VKRSFSLSLLAAIFVSVPFLLYQNFLVPEKISLSAFDSGTTVLSPLERQVVSMLEDEVFVWLQSDETYDGRIKIRDSYGKILAASDVRVLKGETEIHVKAEDALKKSRGDWLMLEVERNGVVTARRHFGWGLIFLTAGQSNAANFECSACGARASLSPHVMFLEDHAGDLTFAPAAGHSPLADGLRQSVWQSLGEKIWKENHIPVAFINVAKGDTRVAQWADRGQLFGRLKYGGYFKLSAVLWHQGEADAGGTSREQYRQKLAELIQRSRRSFDYEVPWFVSRAAHCGGSDPAAEKQIRGAQNDVITQMGLEDIYPGPNTDEIPHPCHFETQSQLSDYAEAWYRELRDSPLLGKYLKTSL
jgi:hypothetical protein